MGEPGNSAVGTLATPQQTASYDRVPPHNLDAEISVLGSMLLSKDAIAEVSEFVGPEDFYRGAHRTIFEATRDLYDRGEPVDAVTLADELERRSQLDSVGGAFAISELISQVPTAANAGYYARIVSDHALRRRLIDAGTQITRMGYATGDGAEEAIDSAEALIYQVAQRGYGSEFTSMKDLLTASFELIEKLHENDSAITGLATGFMDFDELTAGLQPANLVILAARPAMGKSTLVTNMATHIAVEQRQPVVMFSLEMSKMELVQRILAGEARVDSDRLRTGRLQESDWPKLSQAMGRLAEAPLFIDDTPGINMMEIRSKCRRLKQKHGLDLIIVDYLQLMQSHRRAENRVQEVSELSRGLKILAKELDVPVVALSQLSRRPEDRTDKRPQLADLRESGCVTADTRILRADTGREVTVGDLYASGEQNIPVWTLGHDYKVTCGVMTSVFATGTKAVFRLRLASGREVKASANHPFLTIDGWRRLDELSAHARIAVPRCIGEPSTTTVWEEEDIIVLAHMLGDADSPISGRRSPAVAELDQLGHGGKGSRERFIPPDVFAFKDPQVALFLRHLWAAGGRLSLRRDTVELYFASHSRRLVDDLQLLLLRYGVRSCLRTVRGSGVEDTHRLEIAGAEAQLRFLTEVGLQGLGQSVFDEVVTHSSRDEAPSAVDTVPAAVWTQISQRRQTMGLRPGDLSHRLGRSYDERRGRSVPRPVLRQLAAALDDSHLLRLAESDIFWDRVVAIEPLGEEPVFDGTVAGTHNFMANNVIVENSIEQDADIVSFIYRDDVYDPDSAAKGEAELIVAKHRNGPLRTIRLSFIGHHSRFASMARGPLPPSVGGGGPL